MGVCSAGRFVWKKKKKYVRYEKSRQKCLFFLRFYLYLQNIVNIYKTI